jgi:hypothetical protein
METRDVAVTRRAELLDSLRTFETCGDQFAPESIDAAAKHIDLVLSVTEKDVASWLEREGARRLPGDASRLDDVPFFILLGQLSVRRDCQQYITQHIDAAGFADMRVYLATLLFLQGNREPKVITVLSTAVRSGSLIDPREILLREQVEQIEKAIAGKSLP